MSSTEKTEPSEQESPAAKARRTERPGLIAAGALLAACAGLVLYGVLDDEEQPERKVPTASVTYEVTGEGKVEVTYLARSEEGRATVAKNVELPWKKTVRVPLGQPPTVNIVLDEQGGQVRCALAIRGKHVQSSTASGTYGRATCSGELPAPVPTDASTN